MLYNRLARGVPSFDAAKAEQVGRRKPARKPVSARLTNGDANFDYIVIGAGSAGCALVNTLLSSGMTSSVLLIEAGGSNNVPDIQNFTEAMHLRGTVYDWNDVSQPQNCMDGQPVAYDAGVVDGGSSSINGMVWVRGNPLDYDNWAANGCVGWDYNSLLPVFVRTETYAGGGSNRGVSGPINVTNQLSQNSLSSAFTTAMTNLGYAANPDYNSGTQNGVFYTQLNVLPTDPPIYGIRQDTFSTMVQPFANDSRLLIANNTVATKLLLDNNNNVVGVQVFIEDAFYTVGANIETIVCAGTLRSPQLLMLSGIGDPGQLANVGIPCLVPLSGVGQNLQDQLIVFVVRSLQTIDPDHFSVMDNGVFVGSVNAQPDYQTQTFYMVANPGFPPNSFAVGNIILHPSSRGSVTLASASPLDRPLIQPMLLCNQNDVTLSLQGLKLARQMADEFAASSNWLGAELMPGPNVQTDAELIAYMNQSSVPDFHFVGTCKMGPQSDPAAVVNPQLQVNGVGRLRVADASIMPTATSGNTNCPSITIGGRCGDFIIASGGGGLMARGRTAP
jgi:choline dehydrogenase